MGLDADVRPMRTAIRSLRRKLSDYADNPTYIITEFRVGYGMLKREEAGGTAAQEQRRLGLNA